MTTRLVALPFLLVGVALWTAAAVVSSENTMNSGRSLPPKQQSAQQRRDPIFALPRPSSGRNHVSRVGRQMQELTTIETIRAVGHIPRLSNKSGDVDGKGLTPTSSPDSKGTGETTGKGSSGEDDDDDYDDDYMSGNGKGSNTDDDYVSKGHSDDGKGEGKGKGSKDSKSSKSSKTKKSSKGSKSGKGGSSPIAPHPGPVHQPTHRPSSSSGDQPARPPSPTSPSAPVTSPTRPPYSGETIAVTLPLFAVDYTLAEERTPSRDEYLELETVTSDYFEEYMLEAYSASTQATLVRFETNLQTSIFRFGEPVHVQYESIAFFSEDSVILPQPNFLYSVLTQTLDDDSDYITTLESELAGTNIFTRTTKAKFVEPEDPPPGSSGSNEEQNDQGGATAGTLNRERSAENPALPAVAGAAAGISVLAAAFLLYRGRRRVGQNVSTRSYYKNSHGGATVSGETYETFAAETHEEDDTSTSSLTHNSPHQDDEIIVDEMGDDGSQTNSSVQDEENGKKKRYISGGASVESQSDSKSSSSFWHWVNSTSKTTSTNASRKTMNDYDAFGKPTYSSKYANECIERFMDDGSSTIHESSKAGSDMKSECSVSYDKPTNGGDDGYPIWKRLQDVERLKNRSRRPKTVEEVEQILSQESSMVEID